MPSCTEHERCDLVCVVCGEYYCQGCADTLIGEQQPWEHVKQEPSYDQVRINRFRHAIYVDDTQQQVRVGETNLAWLLDLVEFQQAQIESLKGIRDGMDVIFEELQERIKKLEACLDALRDEDDCHFDHHGYCQAHSWLNEEECPQKTLKSLLPKETNDARKA